MNRLILSAPNYVKSLLLFTLHCSYNFKFLSLYDIFDKCSKATSSLHTAHALHNLNTCYRNQLDINIDNKIKMYI